MLFCLLNLLLFLTFSLPSRRGIVKVPIDVWGTSVEIPYWWLITIQIWVVLLSGWSKFRARSSSVILRENSGGRRKMSTVFFVFFVISIPYDTQANSMFVSCIWTKVFRVNEQWVQCEIVVLCPDSILPAAMAGLVQLKERWWASLCKVKSESLEPILWNSDWKLRSKVLPVLRKRRAGPWHSSCRTT